MPLRPREQKATDMNELLLSEVSDLASRLPIEAVTQPVTRQHVALNRFFRGRATEAAESLLEYTIGLEAVLLPRKFEGELAFRLRVNAAWLLAENRIERHEVAKRLRKVYEIRSALVHGLNSPSAEDVRGAAAWAEDVLRRLLVRCISLGWPDDHELALLALG